MNCCDHNECCGHSNDRIGAEIGMLHNLLRRQMACMTEKTANAANVTGMQAMIVHHLIIHEKQGDIFQKDLENAFQMRRSTATGILQLMEQHGIIHREPVEHDGRLKRLVLTEQARAMDEYITERMKQMEQLLRQGITVLASEDTRVAAAYGVIVDIVRLEATTGGIIALEARWTLIDPGANRILGRGSFAGSEKISMPEIGSREMFSAVVAGESRLLERFGADLGRRIAALAERRG